MGECKFVVSVHRLFQRPGGLQKSAVAQGVRAFVVPDPCFRGRLVRRGLPPAQEKPAQQRDGDNSENEYAQVGPGTASLLDYRGERAGRMSFGLLHRFRRTTLAITVRLKRRKNSLQVLDELGCVLVTRFDFLFDRLHGDAIELAWNAIIDLRRHQRRDVQHLSADFNYAAAGKS